MSEDNNNLLNKFKKERKNRTKVEKQDPLLKASTREKKEINKTESESLWTIEELETKLENFPKTKRRSGIVIEEQITEEILEFCRSNKITIEVFLEASWVTLKNPDQKHLLDTVTQNARTRYIQRKEAGKLRRLLSTVKKIKK